MIHLFSKNILFSVSLRPFFQFFIKIFEKKNFEKIKLKIFKSFLEFFLKNTNLFLERFDLNSIFKIVKRNIFHRNFQKQKLFELK